MNPESLLTRCFKANRLKLDNNKSYIGNIEVWLKTGFQCQQVSLSKRVQTLWSGYGEIVKFNLMINKSESSSFCSVIVKWVLPPQQVIHPKGWQSQLAHERKLTSYQVEMNAYQLFNQAKKSPGWPEDLRLPHCYQAHFDTTDFQLALILEDLDASGFSLRFSQLSPRQTLPCIAWLAKFHAYFLHDTSLPHRAGQHLLFLQGQEKVKALGESFGLWPIGSYWHLETRVNEWESMPESPLKANAASLDKVLNNLQYQTIIHGDAKVANFCFSLEDDKGERQVAALDFQYTGYGCGMKDLVYFLGSCLSESQCQAHWQSLLSEYFLYLRAQLTRLNSELDLNALEQEWRFAFELAWADFQRFIEGWSPNHKKNTAFSRAITQRALAKLNLKP